MCFSAAADFTAGTAVAGVGVATLRLVRPPRELLVAALPLLFGLHQLDEGFVWLWLDGHVTAGAGHLATSVYVIFAHALLPLLLPLGFLLLARPGRERWPLWPLLALGTGLAAYMLWQVTAYPVGVHEEARCVDYVTHAPDSALLALLYVVCTCGPSLLSRRRHLRLFGLAAVGGMIVVGAVRADELTSLWCIYAALVSLLVLLHFRRERRESAEARERGEPGYAA